jgi:hypothetical protein
MDTSQVRIFYMKSLEEIKALLSQYKPIIQDKYKISEYRNGIKAPLYAAGG